MAISSVEVAAFHLSSKVMDHPSIGRKRSVYFGFFIVLAATLLIFIFGEDNKIPLFLIFVIIKFVITSTFMVLPPLSRPYILIPQRYTKL
jgi:Na+/melibiose symporter-like transporter